MTVRNSINPHIICIYVAQITDLCHVYILCEGECSCCPGFLNPCHTFKMFRTSVSPKWFFCVEVSLLKKTAIPAISSHFLQYLIISSCLQPFLAIQAISCLFKPFPANFGHFSQFKPCHQFRAISNYIQLFIAICSHFWVIPVIFSHCSHCQSFPTMFIYRSVV